MHFCLQRGRLKLELRVQHLGRDLQVILSGGAAHLGAVALAAPDKASETALFVLPGHREDQLARRMARRMADGSSSGACRCRRLPPNNSRLEQLTLEMLVYGEKRPPTRISRQGFVCALRRNGRRGSFSRRRICELYG